MKKVLFMIVVVILRPTWSQPVADLYFDNDSVVYMEVSKSCLSAIIFISTQHKTWLWSDMHRKGGNFITIKKKRKEKKKVGEVGEETRQRTQPWDFGLPCVVNSCMLSSLRQWDVTKPPSPCCTSPRDHFKVRYHQVAVIASDAGPKTSPRKQYH